MATMATDNICCQCSNKEEQIIKLQNTLGFVVQANLKMKAEHDVELSKLREKLASKYANSETFLKMNKYFNENERLKERVKRLERKIELINGDLSAIKFISKIEIKELPTRTANALLNGHIISYFDLMDQTEAELLRARNFGRGSLSALKAHIRSKFPQDFNRFSLFKDNQNDPH